MMLDIQKYYGKMASHDVVSEDEIMDLLKDLTHFRGATAYMASCQAATLESLPKSASKSARGRHVRLCDAAAKMLSGDGSPIKYPSNSDVASARDRCITAVAAHQLD